MEGLSDDCIFLVLEKVKDTCLPFFSLSCSTMYDLRRKGIKTQVAHIVASVSRFKLGEIFDWIDPKRYVYYSEVKFSIVNIMQILVTNVIALKGNLEVLKYAHTQGYKFDHSIIVKLANRGNLEMIKYIDNIHEEIGYNKSDTHITNTASYNGNLEAFKLFRSLGYAIDISSCVRYTRSKEILHHILESHYDDGLDEYILDKIRFLK
jgi:hypothetical protein